MWASSLFIYDLGTEATLSTIINKARHLRLVETNQNVTVQTGKEEMIHCAVFDVQSSATVLLVQHENINVGNIRFFE